MHPPGDETKSHNRFPTSAFFLARARVHSKENAVMAEVVNLLEDLSKKFDLLHSDVDSLKERARKRKKRKGKRSRRHHTRSRSRSRSRSTRQSTPITRVRKSRRDSPSRSRSPPLSPRRGTRGHPEDQRSPSSGAATSSRSGDIRSNATPQDSERNSGPSRAWDKIPVDETPDYNELFAWGDSDNEECPISSNLAAVSESTASLVKEACTKRLPNGARLQTRNAFPLPQVVATRTPQLDSFIKLEVSQPVKSSDKEWARIQTFVLDALAPLTSLLETDSKGEAPLTSLLETDSKGETITHDQALDAAVTAVQLLGNASAQITHGRRTKVLTHLNKSLLPLLEEDDNFKDVAPSLFGPEFARKSKELIDQVKAIWSTTQKDGKSFFRQGPPKSRGGLQSTTRERWRPELRERQSPVPAEPESSGDQTIDLPVYTDHLIINYKGTLACQIVCMGV